MKRVTLHDTWINGQHFEHIHTILDDNGQVLLLPLLFAVYLETVGTRIEYVRVDRHNEFSLEAREKPIGQNSINAYIAHLYKYLGHVNELAKNDPIFSVHQSNRSDSRFVNDYLNNVLVHKYGITSLEEHCAALLAYFNFLAFFQLSPPVEVKITRKARQAAALMGNKPHLIQYVSKKKRSDLLLSCKSKCEKLIMRMGSEVGLRSSENCGILLKSKNKTKGFLLELFDKLDDPQFAQFGEFEYVLHGRFTKGGRTRQLYFKRELLSAMRDYYLTERAAIVAQTQYEPDALFLRVAPNRKIFGTGITPRHASNVFALRQKSVQSLNPHLSYHCLRHTFGTELFYDELQCRDGRETRSQSAALLVVAIRLGHKLTKSGLAPETTTRYIRMYHQMLNIEENGSDIDHE